MLADAAVIGKVFWAGAIAQMGERDLDRGHRDAPGALAQGARASLTTFLDRGRGRIRVLARARTRRRLRAAAQSSRASRHVAAARWIESKAPERVEDLADVLAYHYATALELAQAAGQTEQATELETPALRFLPWPGSVRSAWTPPRRSRTSSERSRSPLPDTPNVPRRSCVSVRPRPRPLATPRQRLPSRRPSRPSARPETSPPLPVRWATLSRVLGVLGDPRSWSLPVEALALLEPLGPSPALVGCAHRGGRHRRAPGEVRGRDRARRPGARARLRARPPPSSARPGCRGLARCSLGDSGGLDDFREAIELATEAGLGSEVAMLHNNLGVTLWAFEGPEAYLEVLREGIAYAKPRGLTATLDILMLSSLDALVEHRPARRGARPGRRDGPAARGEWRHVRPARCPRSADPGLRPAR